MRLAIALLVAATAAAPAAVAAGELDLTPYLWIPSVNGSIGTGGGGTGLGDRVSVSFTPEYRIGGAMVNLSWRQDRFTAFGDWTYANVRATSPSPFGLAYGDVHGQVIGNVAQLFAGYLLLERHGMKLDAFIGARGYGLTGRLDLEAGTAPAADLSAHDLWADAAIGLRFAAVVDHHWLGYLRGDIGAGGSRFTWQGYAAAGYQFGWGALLAGWRYLYIDRAEGSLQLKLALSGPVIGANFAF
jgi:hypothetical protein